MDALVACFLYRRPSFIVSMVLITFLWDMPHPRPPTLFRVSETIILTLITLGKYFETLSKGRTSEAIKETHALVNKSNSPS